MVIIWNLDQKYFPGEEYLITDIVQNYWYMLLIKSKPAVTCF